MMESCELNSVESLVKLEPDDFLHVASLSSSPDIADDFTAAHDEETSLDLVTNLASIFHFLRYLHFAVIFLLICCHTSQLTYDVSHKHTHAVSCIRTHKHTSLLAVFVTCRHAVITVWLIL